MHIVEILYSQITATTAVRLLQPKQEEVIEISDDEDDVQIVDVPADTQARVKTENNMDTQSQAPSQAQSQSQAQLSPITTSTTLPTDDTSMYLGQIAADINGYINDIKNRSRNINYEIDALKNNNIVNGDNNTNNYYNSDNNTSNNINKENNTQPDLDLDLSL